VTGLEGPLLQPEPEFITTKQVAERIGRTPEWVRKIRKLPGVGPSYYRSGGRVLYRPSEVMAWLRSIRVG
jgi:hypothetical protein